MTLEDWYHSDLEGALFGKRIESVLAGHDGTTYDGIWRVFLEGEDEAREVDKYTDVEIIAAPAVPTAPTAPAAPGMVPLEEALAALPKTRQAQPMSAVLVFPGRIEDLSKTLHGQIVRVREAEQRWIETKHQLGWKAKPTREAKRHFEREKKLLLSMVMWNENRLYIGAPMPTEVQP